MDQTPITCPDCGLRNPPGTRECLGCNYPLSEAAGPPGPEGGAGKPFVPKRPERPKRDRMEPVAMRLWMVFGVLAAASVLYIALQENVKRATPPVPGASAEQLQRADELRRELERDSTSVEARVALGNLLYDTANWSEAIRHYSFVVARDSTRVPVLVDLGVSYFNSGQAEVAEGYFRRALRHDPHQPVAHFNMGIVYENRKDSMAAMRAYHQALQSDPPEELKQEIIKAMQRVQQSAGRTAPPLPGGP